MKITKIVKGWVIIGMLKEVKAIDKDILESLLEISTTIDGVQYVAMKDGDEEAADLFPTEKYHETSLFDAKFFDDKVEAENALKFLENIGTDYPEVEMFLLKATTRTQEIAMFTEKKI